MTLEWYGTRPAIRVRSREAPVTTTGARVLAPKAGEPLVQPVMDRHREVGFVGTPAAFRESMAAAGAAGALEAIRAEAAAAGGTPRGRLHGQAAELVSSAGPSGRLVAAVADAYPGLGIEDFGPARVVVRVVGEPGGRDRSTPVRGLRAVLAAIVDRWADAARNGDDAAAVLVHVAPPSRAALRGLP